MGLVATSFSLFLVSNLRATLAYYDKFRANESTFSRMSLCRFVQVSSVKYVLAVLLLFNFRLP